MWFKNKKESKISDVPNSVIFNVDNFNDWFNDKNNNAVYAHLGIFLRTDKLSLSQVEDYILKKYNLDPTIFDFNLLYDFEEKIRSDWFNKLKSNG